MTRDNPELVVVMPVYNEEKIIEQVVEEWSNELTRLDIFYKIHIYDDGSTDNTAKILREYFSNKGNIVVHNKENSGHGPTILRGYRENCEAEWIFQVDSDDEIGPESFEPLWKKRESYDFLIGRRTNRKLGASRAILSLLARSLVWILFGSGVCDVNCPFRLMRVERFKELFFKIPEDTFATNVIMTGIASKERWRILEIPVQYGGRKTGETSLKKIKLARGALKSLFQTIKFRFVIQSSLH